MCKMCELISQRINENTTAYEVMRAATCIKNAINENDGEYAHIFCKSAKKFAFGQEPLANSVIALELLFNSEQAPPIKKKRTLKHKIRNYIRKKLRSFFMTEL